MFLTDANGATSWTSSTPRLRAWNGEMTQLRELDLCENELVSLPSTMEPLTQLRVLAIDRLNAHLVPPSLRRSPPLWIVAL